MKHKERVRTRRNAPEETRGIEREREREREMKEAEGAEEEEEEVGTPREIKGARRS